MTVYGFACDAIAIDAAMGTMMLEFEALGVSSVNQMITEIIQKTRPTERSKVANYGHREILRAHVRQKS
jgi:hypothetical protein